jgi:hypothetical protein
MNRASRPIALVWMTAVRGVMASGRKPQAPVRSPRPGQVRMFTARAMTSPRMIREIRACAPIVSLAQ